VADPLAPLYLIDDEEYDTWRADQAGDQMTRIAEANEASVVDPYIKSRADTFAQQATEFSDEYDRQQPLAPPQIDPTPLREAPDRLFEHYARATQAAGGAVPDPTTPITFKNVGQGTVSALNQFVATNYAVGEDRSWFDAACSAASYAAVMNYLGRGYNISDAIRDLGPGITQNQGLMDASLKGMEGAFRAKGVEAMAQKMDMATLMDYARQGAPVIVDAPNSGAIKGWGNAGHVFVVNGLDNDGNFVVADSAGVRSRISQGELQRMWGGQNAGPALTITGVTRTEGGNALHVPSTGNEQVDWAMQRGLDMGLDPELIRRLLMQESGGKHTRPDGSIVTSPMGARGMMQVMPETEAAVRKKYGITTQGWQGNVEVGLAYFKEQLDTFKDPRLALAAYNAGPGAVMSGDWKNEAYRGYQETRDYVRIIGGDYRGTGYSAAGTALTPAKRNPYTVGGEQTVASILTDPTDAGSARRDRMMRQMTDGLFGPTFEAELRSPNIIEAFTGIDRDRVENVGMYSPRNFLNVISMGQVLSTRAFNGVSGLTMGAGSSLAANFYRARIGLYEAGLAEPGGIVPIDQARERLSVLERTGFADPGNALGRMHAGLTGDTRPQGDDPFFDPKRSYSAASNPLLIDPMDPNRGVKTLLFDMGAASPLGAGKLGNVLNWATPIESAVVGGAFKGIGKIAGGVGKLAADDLADAARNLKLAGPTLDAASTGMLMLGTRVARATTEALAESLGPVWQDTFGRLAPYQNYLIGQTGASAAMGAVITPEDRWGGALRGAALGLAGGAATRYTMNRIGPLSQAMRGAARLSEDEWQDVLQRVNETPLYINEATLEDQIATRSPRQVRYEEIAAAADENDEALQLTGKLQGQYTKVFGADPDEDLISQRIATATRRPDFDLREMGFHGGAERFVRLMNDVQDAYARGVAPAEATSRAVLAAVFSMRRQAQNVPGVGRVRPEDHAANLMAESPEMDQLVSLLARPEMVPADRPDLAWQIIRDGFEAMRPFSPVGKYPTLTNEAAGHPAWVFTMWRDGQIPELHVALTDAARAGASASERGKIAIAQAVRDDIAARNPATPVTGIGLAKAGFVLPLTGFPGIGLPDARLMVTIRGHEAPSTRVPSQLLAAYDRWQNTLDMPIPESIQGTQAEPFYRHWVLWDAAGGATQEEHADLLRMALLATEEGRHQAAERLLDRSKAQVMSLLPQQADADGNLTVGAGSVQRADAALPEMMRAFGISAGGHLAAEGQQDNDTGKTGLGMGIMAAILNRKQIPVLAAKARKAVEALPMPIRADFGPVAEYYAQVTPARTAEMRERTFQVVRNLLGKNVTDEDMAIVQAANDLMVERLEDLKVITSVRGLDDVDRIMATGGFTTILDAPTREKRLELTKNSVGPSRFKTQQQLEDFLDTRAASEEQAGAPNAIYAYLHEGQAINAPSAAGKVSIVFDPQTTERVATPHHAFGLLSPNDPLHVEHTPKGLQDLMWDPDTVRGTENVAGRELLNTFMLVGPDGENQARATAILTGVAGSTGGGQRIAEMREIIARRDPEELALWALRGASEQYQPMSLKAAAEFGKDAVQGEEMKMAANVGKQRTELLLPRPGFHNIRALYVVGDENVKSTQEAIAKAQEFQAYLREKGIDVPIIQKKIEVGQDPDTGFAVAGDKTAPPEFSPGRAQLVEDYQRYGMTNLGGFAAIGMGEVGDRNTVDDSPENFLARALTTGGALVVGASVVSKTPVARQVLDGFMNRGKGMANAVADALLGARYQIGAATDDLQSLSIGDNKAAVLELLPSLANSLREAGASRISLAVARGGYKMFSDGSLAEENSLALTFRAKDHQKVLDAFHDLGYGWKQEAVLVQQHGIGNELQAVVDLGRRWTKEEMTEYAQALKETFGGWTFSQGMGANGHSRLIITSVHAWGGPDDATFRSQVGHVLDTLSDAGEDVGILYNRVRNNVLDTTKPREGTNVNAQRLSEGSGEAAPGGQAAAGGPAEAGRDPRAGGVPGDAVRPQEGTADGGVPEVAVGGGRDAAADQAAAILNPEVQGRTQGPRNLPENIRVDKFSPGLQDILARQTVEGGPQWWDDLRRGVVTWDEMRATALEMGEDFNTVSDLLNRTKGAYTAEELTTLRMLWNGHMRQIDRVTQDIAAGDTRIETAALLEALGDEAMVIARQLRGGTTEAGRALGAQRMNIRQAIERGDVDAMSTYLAKTTPPQVAKNLSLQIRKLDPNDPNYRRNLFSILQKRQDPTWWDKLDSWRYFNMLSSYKTHTAQMVSNVGNLAGRPLFNLAAGRPGEALADARGILSAMGDARNAAWQTLRTGISEDALNRAETARPSAWAGSAIDRATGGVAHRVIESPGTLLAASDDFFRALSHAGELTRLAYVEAKGDWQRVEQILQNPSEEMLLQAADAAKRTTFQQDPTGFAKSLMKLRAEHRSLGLILPFIKTPANIYKLGMQLAVDPVVGAYGMATKTGRDRQDAQAKTLIGSAMYLGIANLAMSGNLSGDGPRDPDKRALLESTGWQPNSIRVAGRWVAYGNLGPIAVPLAIVSNAHDQIVEGKKDDAAVSDIALAALSGVIKTLTDTSYVSGVGDFFAMLENPEAGLQRVLTAQARSILVPAGAMAGAIQRQTDQYVRDPGKLRDDPAGALVRGMMAQIPGFSGMVRERLDGMGQPIRNDTSWQAAVVPFRSRDIEGSPVAAAALENGFAPGAPAREIEFAGQTRKLTDAERYEIQRARGGAVEPALERLIATPEYQAADEKGKQKLMQAISRQAGEGAQRSVLGRDPVKEPDRPAKYKGVEAYSDDEARIDRAKAIVANWKSNKREVPTPDAETLRLSRIGTNRKYTRWSQARNAAGAAADNTRLTVVDEVLDRRSPLLGQ